MYWRIIENHTGLTYRKKIYKEMLGSKTPLFDDEAEIQLEKYGKKNYQFNEGHYKVCVSGFDAFVENVYLEPRFFILIKHPNILIKESIVFDWYRISVKEYLYCIFFINYKKIDEAVIFDAYNGLNIFHFYNDILPKLFINSKKYLNKPYLISEELYNSKLFQHFLKFVFVNKIKWRIVKKQEYLSIGKAILIKTCEYNLTSLKKIADYALNECPASIKRLKIFINRKEQTGRTISNFGKLEPILKENNFVIIYLEDLCISKQIEYFSRAEVIVGIHGAGLTNIIFSYKNKPTIVEITASDYIPTHYYWLSQAFQFNYHLFLGDKLQYTKAEKTTFGVDEQRLRKILSTFN